MNKFKLSDNFVNKYKHRKIPFGFNGLGEIVYMRTYSRIKENGKNEKWWETVERVVNGTYNLQKTMIDAHGLGWNAWKAQKSAQEMYDRIFNMKFLPPGRGLWAMGSKITEEKKIFAALNNCAFVSTEDIKDDCSKPFCFMMDMSMLGVGVGFDTRGESKISIKGPNTKRNTEIFVIPDTREGWVESLRLLLESHFLGTAPVKFDYSKIRKPGEPIKGFGGVSSGFEPLKSMHDKINKILTESIGQPISVRNITDIMNLVGVCVVSGNIRRSASIAFGKYDDDEYLDLKNYEKNPERKNFGWASNNSIFSKLGMDYSNVSERTKNNGEPGYIWLDNIQQYSRVNENSKDNKDFRATGCNPCGEQSLESYEICCLVETFPNNHESFEDFKRTLKYAYLYAKTVTLGKTHWPETNRVMLRNRRIGCSMSGIAQFISNKGLHELKNWMGNGYDYIQELDEEYSNWFAVPRSIKTTSIKPSGTISLLAGATPGIHHPESRYYIRRVRIGKDSELIEPLKNAGYKIEPAEEDPKNTFVVEVPISIGDSVRTVGELNIWEQVSLAAFIQKYWADNQVSCTVTFKKSEEKEIKNILNYFQYQLKGISFLPKQDLSDSSFKHLPYEEITKEKYNELSKDIKKIKFGVIKKEEADVEKFCDGETCSISFGKKED